LAADRTAAALASIAKDRDARFNDVKRFAVTALSQLRGPDVTRDLLALIQSDKTPSYLYETAVEVLVTRRDPAGLSHLAAALDIQHDYVKGHKPRAVGVIALSIAAMAGKEMNAASRASATEALLLHLKAPETKASDLVGVIKALGTIGGGAELADLRSFLLAYRADPAFSTQVAAVSATIDVLLTNGGAEDREIVSYVAGDARTQPGIAEYAERALEQTAAGLRAQRGQERDE
jgi:hypothetical protein